MQSVTSYLRRLSLPSQAASPAPRRQEPQQAPRRVAPALSRLSAPAVLPPDPHLLTQHVRNATLDRAVAAAFAGIHAAGSPQTRAERIERACYIARAMAPESDAPAWQLEQVAPRLTQMLCSPHARQRRAAAQITASLVKGARMEENLARTCLPWITHSDPETRFWAARILASCIGSERDAALCDLAKDPDRHVRIAAYVGLGADPAWLKLREPHAQRWEMCWDLAEQAGWIMNHSMDDSLRRVLAEHVAQIKAKLAATHAHSSKERQSQAARCATVVKALLPLAPPLRWQMLETFDAALPHMQGVLIGEIAQLPDPAALGLLQDLMQWPRLRAHDAMARALFMRAEPATQLAWAARVGDGSATVAALAALDGPVALAQLEQLEADWPADVPTPTAAIAQLLLHVGGDGVIPRLCDLARAGEPEAILALGEIGGRRGLAVLLELLPSHVHLPHIIEALHCAGDSKSLIQARESMARLGMVI